MITALGVREISVAPRMLVSGHALTGRRARLYVGLPPDPEGKDPFAFRQVEDGTLVLIWLGEV